MTIQKLRESLLNEYKQLGAFINYLDGFIGPKYPTDKAKKIIKSVKKKHWTQTPEGKKKLAANARKQWKEGKGKQ